DNLLSRGKFKVHGSGEWPEEHRDAIRVELKGWFWGDGDYQLITFDGKNGLRMCPGGGSGNLRMVVMDAAASTYVRTVSSPEPRITPDVLKSAGKLRHPPQFHSEADDMMKALEQPPKI